MSGATVDGFVPVAGDFCCGCDSCREAAACSNCNSCGCNDRRADCGCNDCRETAACSSCSNGCSCQNCADTQTAGMVYGADHCLKNRMTAAQGIRQGTLFTELHKPFAANPCPSGCAEITDKQALAFAAWELRLYLDTHPCDKAALKLFEEYEHRLNCMNYATSFVPGCRGRGDWVWNRDPWPWETCANNGKE
jgi:spore coat protein JB